MKLLSSILRSTIKSYINTHKEQVLSESIENCHVVGVHSVVLYSNNGRLTRFFITFPNHELYKNWNIGMNRGIIKNNLSVGFHAHHCDLKFIGLKGTFFNIIAEKTEDKTPFKAFKYSSGIKGAGKFEPYHNFARPVSRHAKKEGSMFRMSAKQIHSVFVPKGEVSIWLIREGAEDSTYESLCYSNDDLTSFNFNLINHKMTEDTLNKILELL